MTNLLTFHQTTYKSADFENLNLYSVGSPNYGGVNLIESANLIELAIETGHISKSYRENATSLFWMIFISRWGSLVSILTSNGASYVLERVFPGLNFTDEGRVTKQAAKEVWNLMTSTGGVQTIQEGFKKIFRWGLLDNLNHHKHR